MTLNQMFSLALIPDLNRFQQLLMSLFCVIRASHEVIVNYNFTYSNPTMLLNTEPAAAPG